MKGDAFMDVLYSWVLSSERNIVATFLFLDFMVSLLLTYMIMSVLHYIRVRFRMMLRRRRKAIRARKRRAAIYGYKRNDSDLAA